MKNTLLLFVLLISACTQTLDYHSEIYLNAIEHFENKNHDSTRTLLTLASKEYRLPDTALHYLALSYHLLDEQDSAIYYWRQSVAQNPDFELGHYNLGLMYYYQGDEEEALKNYDNAIKADPNSEKALYNKAVVLYGRGDFTKALNLCRQAISADSNYTLPHFLMGRTYLALGIFDSAQLANNRLVQLDPNNPEYISYLADSESALGKLDKAISLYSKSIELQPKNNPSYFDRATLYHKIKEYNLAKRDYRTALIFDPNPAECRVRLSWVYSEENKLDSMKLELITAINIDSTYSDAHLYLGDYYHRINKKSKACELYYKASELNNQQASIRLAEKCN